MTDEKTTNAIATAAVVVESLMSLYCQNEGYVIANENYLNSQYGRIELC